MDNLRLGVEWDISEDTLKASMANAKKELSGVGQTVEDVQKKVNESLSSIGNGASEQSFTRTAEKQAGILRQVGAEYRNTLANALSAFSGMEGGAQRNFDMLVRLEAEMSDISGAQRELSDGYKRGTVTQRDYLQGARALAVQENEVKQRIAAVNQTIAQNTAVEREAVGSIAQKTALLSQLEQQYKKLSDAQRENDLVGGELRKQYQKLEKEVEEMNSELRGTSSQPIVEAFSMIKSVGAAVGIAFTVDQLISFGKELFNIAKEAEGVRSAFSQIGDERTLHSLREGVKGTVSDLELMKLAVRADAFKIPMDVLATGLEFARRRAVALGKDVQYMTDSFVDGLGRKSTLVLDNLGISAIELQEEIKKTGDFAKAVGVIMERDLAKGGLTIDTLADKTARWSAMWDNMKLKISDVFGNIADTLSGNITIDQNYVASETSSRRQANDLSNVVYVERVKRIQEAQSELDKLALKYQALKAIEKPDKETKSRTAALQMEYTIQNNVLNSMKEQNKAMNEAARIQKGIVSNEELRQQIEDKRSQANSWIVRDDSDRKYVAKLFAEADALQKQLDERQGKTAKKDSTDRTKILEQETKERERILASWAALDADYAAKNLSKNEQEVQAVRDKYAKIRKEIEDFNKKTKGQRISLDGLSDSEDAAVKATRYRQETDALVKELEKRKSAWEEYLSFAERGGTPAANTAFGGTAPADYGTSLQREITGLQGKDSLTSLEKQRLDALLKMQDEHNAEMAKKRRADYLEAYEAAMTHNEKVRRINDDYAQKARDLGNDLTDERKAQLLQERDAAITAANEEAFHKTAIYKRLGEELLAVTRSQVKEQIKAIQSILENGAIAENVREMLEASLADLQVNLKIGVDASNLSKLEAQKGNIQKAIDTYLDVANIGSLQTLTQETLEANPELRELVKQLQEVAQKINAVKKASGGLRGFLNGLKDNEVLGQFNEWAGMASGAFMDMSSALGGVDTEAGYALDTVGQLVGTAADIGTAIASGNPVQMVGALAKGVSTVFSISSRVKEMNAAARKEVEDFYAAAIAGERAYQELVRQRELATVRNNKAVLQGLKDEIALRKQAASDYAKEYEEIMSKLQGQSYVSDMTYTHGTWFRKAKTEKTYASLSGMDFGQLQSLLEQGKLEGETQVLVQRLVEIEQAGYDAATALEELARETAELFTGTTADSITDALTDMFRNGQTSVSDFADFFEETMQDAVLNTFKNKVLADMMADFYDQFSEAAISGDGLDESDIDRLRAVFQDNIAQAKQQYEDMAMIAGVSGTAGSTTNSLSGRITTITQDQADLLAGQLGGMRLLQIESNKIMGQQLATEKDSLSVVRQIILIEMAIEKNTRRSADLEEAYLPYLKGIEANTKDSVGMQLRAAGKFNF